MSESTTTLTRTVNGLELPTVGTYAIDASHSGVEFVVRHLGLAKVRGRFNDFSGEIVVAEQPERSSANVAIQVASIDTREPNRDEHLRTNDFFDAANFPTIDFRTTEVSGAGTQWDVEGELTIKGVTRPVTLEVTYEGAATDPWGGSRIAFSASTEIDREEWGISWNQALDTGGWLVGKKVKLELEVEAVKQSS